MAQEPVVLPCPACGAGLVIKVTPNPKLLNLEHVSMAIIEHTGQVLCACGAVLQVAVGAVPQMLLQLLPIPKAQQQSIIVPGGRLQG